MNAATTNQGTSLANFQLNFPTLPHTFLRSMELSRDVENINIDDVVRLVQNDLSAVTRILRIVNSAYHGVRSEISSIKRAVVVLGPEAVLGIVMSMSLLDMRSSLNMETATPFMNLIRHSIATGFIARNLISTSKLAADHSVDRQELLNEAFTAGLLHDFGKIVLLHNFNEEAPALYESISAAEMVGREAMELERKTFGFSHAETGGYLMKKLRFPATITAIVERHHDVRRHDDLDDIGRTLLYVIMMSNQLANVLGYGFSHQLSEQAFAEDRILDIIMDEKVFDFEEKVLLIEEALELGPRVDAYLKEVV